jgi:anti-anti-sigma factor
MATAPLLAEAMEKALAADGARLAIDFLETEFIDSSGLAALLAVKDAGRDIVLVCHEDGPIHRLMVLTGTDTQFTIVDSIVRAVGGGV